MKSAREARSKERLTSMYQKHLILGIKPTKELYFECIWYQTSSKTIDYVVAAPRIKHRLRYLSK